MLIQDSGVDHETANRHAASFMKTVFGVDVTSYDEWRRFESVWNAAELRRKSEKEGEMMCFRITTHETDNGEYVLRIESTDGSFASLGSLNGKEEADVVRGVLQGALELSAVVDSFGKGKETTSTSWRRGHVNADNMVGGRDLLRYASSVLVIRINNQTQ